MRRFHSLLISSRPPRRRGGKNPARQGAVLFRRKAGKSPAAAAFPLFSPSLLRPLRPPPAARPCPRRRARQNRSPIRGALLTIQLYYFYNDAVLAEPLPAAAASGGRAAAGAPSAPRQPVRFFPGSRAFFAAGAAAKEAFLRRIYLCRHGLPAFPQGEKCCIGGGSDPALSPAGRMQACILGLELHGRGPLRVFHSGMRRAAQTAAYLSEQARPLPAFRELDMGQWEGLTFDAIRRRFPEAYARRGEDPARFPPPGANPWPPPRPAPQKDCAPCWRTPKATSPSWPRRRDPPAAVRRGRRAFGRVPPLFPALWLLLCPHLGRRASPRRGSAPQTGARPQRGNLPRPAARRRRPRGRADHCAAAADLARALCAKVGGDGDLAFRAAALHDIAKGCPDHPRTGADWLRAVGWDAEADIVAGIRIWGRTPQPKRRPCIWPTNCCGARSASPSPRALPPALKNAQRRKPAPPTTGAPRRPSAWPRNFTCRKPPQKTVAKEC